MTNTENPWQIIGVPASDYNVRRVADAGIVPLYWGRDSAGHCLFVVELDGDHTAQFKTDGTSVHGIDVDLRTFGSGAEQGLVLTLEKQVDSDLFQGLCETMISSLKIVQDSSTGLAVALAHLKRWKTFLAGKKSRLLSPEEIRGLFGELLFLRSLYQTHLDQNSAISAWGGPEGAHQDFIFHNTAVEIKVISGKERSTVRISSEDQLEALCDNLYLLIYRLSDLPNSDHALSLNGLVREIEAELNNAEALESFFQRLAAYGYVEMAEYDKPQFVVMNRCAYRVNGQFPRLVRSGLPEGIVRLSYELQLENIKAFECDPDEIGEA
ncbi:MULTISPECIES: PD-(D/E)XK motif protein [Sphingomonadales]|uniref:PD-(D/E)XK motif protein n=1 Tax=Sphingomonadales TaxID=204457 RepID=UPI00326398D8